MKTEISYEWTLETLEDGDIIDNHFSDVLSYDKADLEGKDLGLIRNEGNEHEGLTDRYWAYVKDGKLPEFFTDSMGDTVKIKVPVKYHNELKKYFTNNY